MCSLYRGSVLIHFTANNFDRAEEYRSLSVGYAGDFVIRLINWSFYRAHMTPGPGFEPGPRGGRQGLSPRAIPAPISD